MRPLLHTQVPAFLERFDNFKDAEFRSIEIISSQVIKITLAAQDRARAFDWITVSLEFHGVSDAKLLQENQLSYLDMENGISLLKIENKFAFGITACYNISNITNSSCYVVADSLKYEENQF